VSGQVQAKRDRVAAKFGINPCSRGYEVVVEDTGRPLCYRPSAQSANGVAQNLNRIAADGPEALSAALSRLRSR
jgi:hypothetical protein